jgi:hypothetical protein
MLGVAGPDRSWTRQSSVFFSFVLEFFEHFAFDDAANRGLF